MTGRPRRPTPPGSVVAGAGAALVADDLVALDGGSFVMGTDGGYGYADDGEGPAHEVAVGPFAIARHAVTNAQFAAFVDATGHRTEAERFGWSFVFAGLLPDDFPPTRAVAGAPWWRQVHGASTGLTRRAPTRMSRTARTTPSCTCPGTTRRRSARGRGTRLPDRGRVGVRGARRARGRALPVGRRARARAASTA